MSAANSFFVILQNQYFFSGFFLQNLVQYARFGFVGKFLDQLFVVGGDIPDQRENLCDQNDDPDPRHKTGNNRIRNVFDVFTDPEHPK